MGVGVVGGAAFGATLGGPLGAVVGAAAGLAAGAVRHATGKHVGDHASEAIDQLDEETLGKLVNMVQQQVGPTFDLAELDKIADTKAARGDLVCKRCSTNKVKTSLGPCGHACLCGGCCALLLRSGEPKCPTCQKPVQTARPVHM